MPKGVYTRTKFSRPKHNLGGTKDQFWQRVSKNGPIHPDCGQCWIWIAGKYAQGYGQYRGKKAHRVAYEFSVGPIPKGKMVLHKCDNPACVNPNHLFIGTAQDNMDDKMSKGRGGKNGTKSPCYGRSNGRYVHGENCMRRKV
jgi:hypothetical protein